MAALVFQPIRREALNEGDNTQSNEADAGTRTPDPIITSDVLYQLSYVGEQRPHGTSPRKDSGRHALVGVANGDVGRGGHGSTSQVGPSSSR